MLPLTVQRPPFPTHLTSTVFRNDVVDGDGETGNLQRRRAFIYGPIFFRTCGRSNMPGADRSFEKRQRPRASEPHSSNVGGLVGREPTKLLES